MKKKPKKKIKKKGSKLRKIIPILLVIIAGAIFSLVTPLFNIKEIKVEGNNKVEAETIISLSGLHTGENIFRNSKKKTKEAIKENKYIEDVTIKRKLPGTINLIVKERITEYQIKIINGYVYIDNQGYILEASSKQAKVPLLEGMTTSEDELINGRRLNIEDLNKLNTIIKISDSLKAINLQDLVTSINAENEKNYILYLQKEKKYAYLGDANNLNNKVLYMKTMIENEKNKSGKMIIDGDMSNGFKPYFRKEKVK